MNNLKTKISIWKKSILPSHNLIKKNKASHFNNRPFNVEFRFGSRRVTTIMMLLILQLNVSTANAYSELVPGLTNTARSGFSGTNITAIGEASSHTAVTLIQSQERNNVPCYLYITKHDINGTSSPGYSTWNECNGTSVENKNVGFTLGTGLYVYGIQACTNNKNNHRVKGIRVFGGPIQDGIIQHIGLFDDFSRPNCSTWHSAVYCPLRQVATKVRIHHTGDEINGLSLACRVVADI